MKQIAIDYYQNFHCIASACQHSCCIGWEIDVDDASYQRYRQVSGRFGEKLRRNIVVENDYASFVLDKTERCPFLQKDGLCEIILKLGEHSLCDICTEHPRFYNNIADRTEVGIGLCCEEAARIILSKTDPAKLLVIEQNRENCKFERDEREVLQVRNQLFEIITDRTLSIAKRCQKLLSFGAIVFPQKALSEWADIYLSLERLDSVWDSRLLEIKTIQNDDGTLAEEYAVIYEQLLHYFVYRHFTKGVEDGRYYERLAFSILSIKIIDALGKICFQQKGIVTLEDWVEIVRMYSSEIEYSEDNMQELMDVLSTHIEDPARTTHHWLFDIDKY